MILDFFARYVGQRFALPAFILSIILASMMLVTLIVKLWPVDHTAERQAEQTVRSGAAIGAAGSAAVQTVASAAATESVIDAGVRQTTQEIHHAKNADAVRRAVVAGVCKQASHRLDPACRVQ